MTYKKLTGIIIIGAILLISGVMVYMGVRTYAVWNKTYEVTEQKDEDGKSSDIDIRGRRDSKVFLILGIDEEEGSSPGRSDVIMVKVVNYEKSKILSVSIPRDSRVEVAEQDSMEKINHAYAYGVDIAVKTVRNFLNIDVDYYMALNFKAFVDFIDLIGGLEIDVDSDMEVGEIVLKEGIQTLDGDELLAYVRFREDEEGTKGRRSRQQHVVNEVLDQSLDHRTPANVLKVLDITEDNIQHDIPVSSIVDLVQELSSATSDDYESLQPLPEGSFFEDVWYDVWSIREKEYIRNEIIEFMEN